MLKPAMLAMRGPIARSTLKTSAVLGIRLVVQAGTLLLVARLLGPHDFGAFAGMAALAVMLGMLSTFGTHFLLLTEVSRAPERRPATLPFALTTTLLCGGLLLTAFVALANFGFAEAGLAIDVLWVIGITEMLLQPLLSLPAAEYQGKGRVATAQLLVTLPLLLRMLVAMGIWVSGATDPLRDYAYGSLAASVTALLISGIATRHAWPRPRDWRLPAAHELREASGYAVLSVTAMGPAELDKTLALKLLPLASAGLYATGARIIGALALPVVAMMLSAMPRLLREGSTDSIRPLLRRIFAAALAYSTVLSTLLWLVAPVFPWLFGHQYQGLDDAIRWLTIAIPGLVLRLAAGAVLMAIGRPWMRVGFELFGLASLVLAAVLFTSRFGLHGMAIAMACSEWAMAILGLALLKLQLGAGRLRTAGPLEE